VSDERVLKGRDSLNLPYEAIPGGPVPYDGASSELASALVILAATIEIEGQPHPVLIYRFSRGDGTFYPDRVLVVEKNELADLRRLTTAAVDGALAAARKGAA
jgi:hypothetical protein